MTKLEPTDENLAYEIRILEDLAQTPRVVMGLAFLRELQQLRAAVVRLELLARRMDNVNTDVFTAATWRSASREILNAIRGG